MDLKRCWIDQAIIYNIKELEITKANKHKFKNNTFKFSSPSEDQVCQEWDLLAEWGRLARPTLAWWQDVVHVVQILLACILFVSKLSCRSSIWHDWLEWVIIKLVKLFTAEENWGTIELSWKTMACNPCTLVFSPMAVVLRLVIYSFIATLYKSQSLKVTFMGSMITLRSNLWNSPWCSIRALSSGYALLVELVSSASS